MGFFPHLWPPGSFFKNRAPSLLYPYGALTSCKKLEKTNEGSLRYLKTDTHTDTHGQGRLLRTPSAKLGVQNRFFFKGFSLFHSPNEKNHLPSLKYSLFYHKHLKSENSFRSRIIFYSNYEFINTKNSKY